MKTNDLQWSVRPIHLWLVGVLLFASCTMEETIIGGGNTDEAAEVRFHAGIGVETRVSNPEGDHWDATDTVGIYMIHAGTTLADTVIREGAKNKPYVVASGDGTNRAAFVTAGDTVYYPNGEDVNFVAYYPYSDSRVTTDFLYRMDISDQSAPEILDLLYSNDKATYNSRNHDALLPFDHLMTRLVFDAILTGNSNASLAGLQLEVQNVNTSTDFDLADGTPALDGAGTDNITPLSRYTSPDSVRMEATLIPMTDAGGVHLLFSLNNKTYNATLPQTATGAALEKGKRYTYKVLFDEAEIKLEGELSAWGEEPGDTITPTPGPGEPSIVSAVQIEGYSGAVTVAYTSGATETLTLGAGGRASFGAAYKDETIRSLTLGASAPILIGCKVADANPLSLKVNAGTPVLRDEVDGYIPIGSYAEFQLISTSANLSKKYKQETSLDLMSETWAPIGTQTSQFTGEYDGGEYEITNLMVSVTTSNVGLFGYATNATLRNIRLVSGTINGGAYVGGICGQADGSTSITNAHSGVTVTGTTSNVGGICGQIGGATTITSCRNTGNVKSTATANGNGYVGGIAGNLAGTTPKIKDCDNSGEVEGYSYTGGIAGFSTATTAEITACRNSGTIRTGRNQSGGIVGQNEGSKTLTVTACYNTGAVNNSGPGYTGGIIGQLSSGSTLTACFSTGTVTGSDPNYIGLICGQNGATITSSYWTKGSNTATKGVASGTDNTKAFSASAWPATSESGWGIGDGSGANTYWKSLGGWNGGAPTYPVLWWE
jgi:hypothetical protein